jgi:hypothetical protein
VLANFILDHRRIGYPVMQRLLPVVKQHPQESGTASRECQEISECAQTRLSHGHCASGIGIHDPKTQRAFAG